jgi:hypothetical protein
MADPWLKWSDALRAAGGGRRFVDTAPEVARM